MAKKEIIIFLLVIVGLTFDSSDSFASKTQFAELSFELPPGWSCEKKDASMICLDRSSQTEKNSALVITYKEKAAQDSLQVYTDQLGRPRVLKQGDSSTPSQPLGVREITIRNTKWIEGIHLGSELPNYYTHYYATTSNRFAYLVSISVEKTAHQKGTKILDRTLNSMILKEGSGSQTQGQNNLSENSGASNSIQSRNQNDWNQNQNNRSKWSQQTINVFGFDIKMLHVFLGAGLIVVLGMMIYALTMD